MTRRYNTVKMTGGGKCPHCRRLIKPKCPHCGKKTLVKSRGPMKMTGVSYFVCSDCGKSAKAAPL